MKKIFLFVFSLLSGFIYSQGDDLLLLQYNKGPDPDGFYRKWNFDVHYLTVLMKAKGKYSNPALTYGFGSSVQYKFSKTFGIRSGASYFNLRYKYDLSDNESTDKITYLTIPITVRVSPSRKLIFETGFLYNLLLSAKNSEIQDLSTGSFNYEDGIFKNAFGMVVASQYNPWKRLNVSLQYRFLKKASKPSAVQKNNFTGVLLGLHFFIFDPMKKPI
tara:strand:- start:320 stop:970 length:651 start_codon:yes stop_codon:yes gene_type:complete